MTACLAFLFFFQLLQPDSLQTLALDEEVVVRANRLRFFLGDEVTTWSITRLGPLSLQAGRPLAARFAGLPGIQLQDRENPSSGEKLTMRGAGWRSNFGVRGVHVRYNGFPVTMPDGQTILSAVDPDLISRIDVSPASNGVFWGSGLGGVIALSDLDDRNEAALSGGAFGYKKVIVRQAMVEKNAAAYVRLSGVQSDGWRENSRYRSLRFSVTGTRRFSQRTRLQVSFHGEDAPLAENPGALDITGFRANPRAANTRNALFNARKESRQALAGVLLQHGTLTTGVWGLRRALFNPLSFARVELNRLSGGFFAHHAGSNGSFTWQTGADFGWQRDRRLEYSPSGTGYDSSPSIHQSELFSNAGVFGRAAYEPVPGKGELNAGLRLQRNRLDARPANGFTDSGGPKSFTALLPSAQITLPVEGSFLFKHFFAGVHRSFEPPTLNESSAPAEAGQPALQPERGITFETGLHNKLYLTDRPWMDTEEFAQVRLSFFATRFNRAIEAYESAVSPGETRYRNRGKTLHSGVEYNSSFQSGRISGAQSIQLSYVGFLDGNDRGNRIPGIPVLFSSMRLDAGFGSYEAGLVLHYQTSRFADSGNAVEVQDFSNLSLTASKTLALSGKRSARAFISILNLFNETGPAGIVVNASNGRYYEPAAPASLRMGITASW